MKTILLTGGSGFIGHNILPILEEHYAVLAPTRQELNILDEKEVLHFLLQNKVDYVIHAANSTPAKNSLDKPERMMSDSLKGYFAFSRCQHLFDKMFYFGSGAEFDKRRDIISIKEEDFEKEIPADDYGFAKYIMNIDAQHSANIYNLRIFGCYGPTDAKTKFIRDAIDCCLENRAITIRQNCMFDYMYVEDLAYIMEWFIENNPKYHDYNVCSGKPISLLGIAEIVAEKMNNKKPIEIAQEGWNKEYTADNSRLINEMGGFEFTSIEKGIEKQIEWRKESITNVY